MNLLITEEGKSTPVHIGDAANKAARVTVVATSAASSARTCSRTALSGGTTIAKAFVGRTFISISAAAGNTDRIHFVLGSNATTGNPALEPGQSFTLNGLGMYSGPIDAIPASGTQTIDVVEY